MSETRETVRGFVVETFLFGQQDDLSDTSSFLETGIIDSTGVLQLVAFLEERFGFRLDDAELIPENLDSVEAITGLVARKQASLGGSPALGTD